MCIQGSTGALRRILWKEVISHTIPLQGKWKVEGQKGRRKEFQDKKHVMRHSHESQRPNEGLQALNMTVEGEARKRLREGEWSIYLKV